MNFSQLKTLIWLRWRILAASWRRMGTVGRVVLTVIAAISVVSMLGTIVAAFVMGLQLLPKAQSIHVLIVFDALVLAFLFFWAIGFFSELQRSEPLEIGKLLHLPMSLRGAFLLNYLSSFASLTIAFFGPLMIAISLAMAIVFGWKSLVSFPLIAGFICLVTAISYQIRGWLAKLMSNPRRRRTIVTGFTMVFILTFQLPNAINMYNMRRWRKQRQAEQTQNDQWKQQIEDESLPEEVRTNAKAELDKRTNPEYLKAKEKDKWKEVEQTVATWGNRLNTWIPFGWMPLGISRSLEGSIWQGLLGTIGLFGLTGLCLSSSYRTTIKYYRKAPTAPKKKRTSDKPTNKPRKNALARPFPLTPTVPGTIARANFCSIMRAPEVKMMMLGPIIIVALMCFPLMMNSEDIPAKFAPFIAAGISMAGMIVAIPITFNQFGFDRHAFRSYMLLPINGRDILFGKNLSLAPLLLPIALFSLLFAKLMTQLSILDFFATLLQVVAAFVVLCTLGNYFSTYFPMAVASSAMRKIQPRWQVVLAHMIALFLIPFVLAPILLPTLIGFLNREFEVLPNIPISFLLCCFMLAGCVLIYRYSLRHAGRLFEQRTQEILSEVTRQAK